MTLLCYGDSNTYGFDPRSYFGGRYPAEVRWTHRLAQATGWTVHNAGENGREIPRRAWELQDLLRRAADADLVTLMLGGNDLLQGPPFAAEDAAARMDACLTALLTQRAPSTVLLVSPPPLCLGAWTNAALCRQAARLAPCYRALAVKREVAFADAGAWGWSCSLTGSTSPQRGIGPLPWASKRRWNRWPPSSLGAEDDGYGTTTILFQGGAPMLHIAICDDDPAAVQTHREITEQSLRQCQCAGEISIYTHSDNLLYDITQDHFFFDLILLDIEMPGCTGMEMAEQIRPHLPQGKIIFITSHVEYAIDAFALSIFRYVPKAELAQRLPAALRDAIALITLEDGKTYTIQTSSRLEKLPYREIYFIERDGKNARITTASGVSKVRKSLQQVYEELGAEEFLYIDRGCIVNLIHVMQIKDGMAVLKNGVTLPISRSHLQAVKAEINRYWGEHI
ncbi:MAG: GDSL-type esterase/lipase family protein [Evtepia sp.]